MFGVIGTLMTFGVVAPLTYYSNQLGLFGLTMKGESLNFSMKEILLFASVISATDTVAALTFIKERSEPKLFSVLFGEGVLNDAVCIVIYRIIKNHSQSDGGKFFIILDFTMYTPLTMFGSFILMFCISTLLGMLGGLLCALFLKKMKYFSLNRVQESSIIIFFAFMTYSCTELLGYSPILALLFCGIFMSQYTFYNLSFQAREESSVVTKIMSNIAEAFIFVYLGLTSITVTANSLSISFISLVLVFVLFGRFIAIYGLSFFLK
jgi:NhaP-type Na+/H+ or K+/H+ antiporter